ncbi:hypothetical protein B0H63DRAFT_113910 [Podospora didyma]|uniref:Putative transcription factor kapC n=1 Tax=Podospora didyma TaxID=330526 RepID=A0AAE0NZA1_9PEZI|nr:hypothetical protein B0H63DRAFT_113910 [Podospora didyma]
MMSAGLPPPPDQSGVMSSPTAVGSQGMGMVDMGDGSADNRKAKRELSQSKRAAQNRAAQRAFRQRKEGYIKKLEIQVREYTEMESNYKAMQAENYELREYIIRLQSRLLDSIGEFPQPPPNITLSHARAPILSGRITEPVQSPAPGPGPTSLEVAAQAVAGLTRSEHYVNNIYEHAARSDDDARTAEEITRQLQSDGGPDGLPPAPM